MQYYLDTIYDTADISGASTLYTHDALGTCQEACDRPLALNCCLTSFSER